MAGAAGDRPEGVSGGGDGWPFSGDAFAEYSSAVFAELGGWPGTGAGALSALDLSPTLARSEEMPAASGEAAGASSSSSGDGAGPGKLAVPAAEAAP